MHHRILKSILAGSLAVATFIAGAERLQATLLNYAHLEPNDPNGSVILSDLLNGEIPGIVVGDKIFSQFFYSTLPNDDMSEAQDVEVFGFQDLDGNYGLSFHGVFWDLADGKPSDALLRFTVEVTPQAIAEGWRISDAHLFLGGLGIGTNSFLAVDESFQGLNETLNTYATTLGDEPDQVLSDFVDFSQLYTNLRVTKDILAFSGDGRVPVRVSVIDQSFSQTLIPEPTSLAALTIFGLGLILARRRPPPRDGS